MSTTLKVDPSFRNTRYAVTTAEGAFDHGASVEEVVAAIERAAAEHQVDEVEIDPTGIGMALRELLIMRGQVKVRRLPSDVHPYAR